MELTIEQALQLGIAAHKEGKLQDAERFYRAILQSQPLHPDANHNLGVLAVSVKKVEVALPFFRIALEANPKIEQFWLSYIDALIKEKQFENAKQVFKQARTQGVGEEKLYILETQLKLTAQVDEPILAERSKNLPYPQKHKNLPKQKKGKKKTQDVIGISPPQEQINCLLEHYQKGRINDAEKLALSITDEFPKYHFGWKVLGATLKQSGRAVDSLTPLKKAVQLAPKDAEAHYNLGVTLQELARSEEAVASYYEAIVLKPDFAEAHNNLGIMLHKLGRSDEAVTSYHEAIALKPSFTEAYYNLGKTLEEQDRLDKAVASYKQAIELKPDYAEAHNNLGVTLQELGRSAEAVASYIEAIALKPNYANAIVNLGIAVKNIRFNSSNPKLYPPLTHLLTSGYFTRPKDVAASLLSLLKQDPQIKNLLLKKNYVVNLNEAIFIIECLDKFPLLLHLMRLCPLPDRQFEQLFSAIRTVLLENLDSVKVSRQLICFLSTLSLHCFVNDYIYAETNEETRLVEVLQSEISLEVAKSEQPEVVRVLCLASYRPLHHYDWCRKLESLDSLKEVKRRLLEEPLLEKMIANDILTLAEISDDVSLKVREQYEENPYPRWVKLGLALQPKPISKICAELKLRLCSESIKHVTAPAILIAGCGTGQHSIETASRFSNCHVTAVDLSLASLAYAKRKSNELCLTNIDYLQTDIQHLRKTDKEFDIIECGGVLHHMDDPIAGWRVLRTLLKPGGLMKIGLYSELARQHIVAVRKEIASIGLGASANEIRNFRESLWKSEFHDVKQLSTSSDFYSLSEFRDLVLHVQEHRFTLPEIKNCLDELGLKFCGFENKDVISTFKKSHGNEADIYDLELWHQYEEKNPRAFAGMYQFWCQKPGPTSHEKRS